MRGCTFFDVKKSESYDSEGWRGVHSGQVLGSWRIGFVFAWCGFSFEERGPRLMRSCWYATLFRRGFRLVGSCFFQFPTRCAHVFLL